MIKMKISIKKSDDMLKIDRHELEALRRRRFELEALKSLSITALRPLTFQDTNLIRCFLTFLPWKQKS